MSKKSTIKIKCANCGQEINFVAHDSVNVTLDPNLRDKVFSGEVFRYHCDECGFDGDQKYPLLYHDMDKGFMVYYTYPSGIDEFEYMMTLEQCIDKQILKDLNSKITRRATSERHEFFEKIIILENGYDDRIIEVLRLNLINSFKKEKNNKNVDHTFFDMVRKDSGQKNLVCFLFVKGKEEPFVHEVHPMEYNELYAYFKNRLPHYNNCLVDQAFAEKFIYDAKMRLPIDCKEDDRELFCVYAFDGQFHLCVRKHTFTDEVKVDDRVVIETQGGQQKLGCVKKVTHKNYTVFPKWCSHYDAISSIYGKELSMAIKNVKAVRSGANQIELLKQLRKEKVCFPIRLIAADEDLENILSVGVGNNVKLQNDMRIRFAMYTDEKGKKYFPVYTSTNEIAPNEMYSSIMTREFTDCIDMALNTKDIEGMIVNPDTDHIIIENIWLNIKI